MTWNLHHLEEMQVWQSYQYWPDRLLVPILIAPIAKRLERFGNWETCSMAIYAIRDERPVTFSCRKITCGQKMHSELDIVKPIDSDP
jgi:hypothetical protein